MVVELQLVGFHGRTGLERCWIASIASISIYTIFNKYDYDIKIEYNGKNKRVYEANVPTFPTTTRT